MDVYRLNKTTFLPEGGLIESFSSKIWTERYAAAGDFQFKTTKIKEVGDKLPEDSLVAIRQSSEVMIVETHEIEDNADGVPELTIKGRSFETFLENRITSAVAIKYQTPWVMKKAYTTAEALACYIWNSVVNPTLQDVTKESASLQRAIEDTIPNLRVSDSSTLVEADAIWWLQSGVIYTSVLDFLSLGTLGIRNIRPASKNAYIVSIESDGDYVKTLTANVPQLRIDIYNGLDRTKNQSVNDRVIFNYDQGHLSRPKYIFSSKGHVNHVMIESSKGANQVYLGDDPTPYGLDRKSTWMDGGTIDAGVPFASYSVQQARKAKVELKKHRKIRLLDSTATPFSPFVYNEHYSLGDKVTVMGERGFNQTMMVEEYIRTEDRTGELGIPTLVVPE